jgi:hypothetical protein
MTIEPQKAQRPDGKPGRELAQRAEGSFRLDFLVLLCKDKRTSPAAMSGENILVKRMHIC